MKERVCEANLELVRHGVVIYTWGNVSEIDRAHGIVVIKPSGVSYDTMKPEDMVVVDLESGEVVEGDLRPSSDTDTHLELYRAFPEIGGITHTHSTYGVTFAQAGRDIPPLGTTHADSFYGSIPCSRVLREDEVKENYEKNTGKVMVETLQQLMAEIPDYDVLAVPGMLVHSHGPFAWGKDASSSVKHAVILEHVAEMAWRTIVLNPESQLKQYVLDKHYERKHGKNAYYGQK